MLGVKYTLIIPRPTLCEEEKYVVTDYNIYYISYHNYMHGKNLRAYYMTVQLV